VNRLRIAAVTSATLAALATAGLAAGPAAAATVRPNTSFIGTCYPFRSTASGGGWCDGNGPNWVYQARVYCANGVDYTGVTRWAGDRRGSTATCEGSNAVEAGLDVYYNGIYEFSSYT
jgi:hypothetical protein